MDEEMEVLIEFDPDYEFDAARFFDFTRPESISESIEAQRWFQFAPNYPPSPFIAKLKWSEDLAEPEAGDATLLEDCGTMKFISNNSEIAPVRETENGRNGYYTDMAPDTENARMNSLRESSKLKTLTFMKPTASHLAKQSKARSRKPVTEVDERSTQIQPNCECDATKRQKVESGYLRKVAQLKHQPQLSHKLSKKVGSVETNSVNHKHKVTIPKEPDLETAQRAKSRRFRSKNVSEAGQQDHNTHIFKARPLNRKILDAPSLALPKKSKPQMPVFQMFQLKTMERAMQHSSASVLSAQDLNSVISSECTEYNGPFSSAVERNHVTLHRPKARSSTTFDPTRRHTRVVQNNEEESLMPAELKEPTEKQHSAVPPIELFNKLSLKSEFGTAKSHQVTKGLKENAIGSVNVKLQRFVEKLNCEIIRRNPQSAYQHNINRSLDIR